MDVTSYLFLDGRCEEAIRFHEQTLVAKVGIIMRLLNGRQAKSTSSRKQD